MTTQITTLNNNQISAATTDELKRQLAASLTMTAKHLEYMGMIWAELENRGEDLSSLRHGLAAYLPMIAHNRIDAEIVIRYAGQKTLLSALSALPIEEQRRLADSGYVTVATHGDDGIKEIQTPLSSLAAADVYRVFADDRVRTVEEQIKILDKRDSQASTPIGGSRPRKARRVKIDLQNKVLIVGDVSADIDRVITQLSKFYNIDLAELICNAVSDHPER